MPLPNYGNHPLVPHQHTKTFTAWYTPDRRFYVHRDNRHPDKGSEHYTVSRTEENGGRFRISPAIAYSIVFARLDRAEVQELLGVILYEEGDKPSPEPHNIRSSRYAASVDARRGVPDWEPPEDGGSSHE